jgi:hypothetical protein
MNLLGYIVAIALLLLISPAMRAQSVARMDRVNSEALTAGETARVLAALKNLENDVIVYRSLGEFEVNGKLARVSLPGFEQKLSTVSRELGPVLSRLPASKLKIELTNALDSFQDGVFFWRRIDQPRVVNVLALSYAEPERSAADNALLATTPYTVAILWRQAHNYLSKAEKTLAAQQTVSSTQHSLR